MILNNEIRDIKMKIYDKTRHPYLDRFVQKPEVDEEKIMVLLSMFKHSNRHGNLSDYVAAIMIMQMAMDMHDTVGVRPSETSTHRPRQLTVLAGDYYSSQYYAMLADIGDFALIRRIAEAVRQLNEHKTVLIRGDWQWSRFLDHLKFIETGLLLHVSDHLGLTGWFPLITPYFTRKRLVREREAILNGQTTPFLEPLFSDRPDKRDPFLEKAAVWIKELESEVKSVLKKMTPIKEWFVDNLLVKLENSLSSRKKLVEEG